MLHPQLNPYLDPTMLAHLSLLALTLAPPAQDTTRALTAHRLASEAEAPRIDGVLDEAVWAQAPVAGDFVQQRPRTGEPATQRTEGRVLLSDDALYVAMRMYDSRPDSIAAQMARRDAIQIYSDWAFVLVDSFDDDRTGFRFSVNPRGVRKDVYHYDDGREDLGWDPVWSAETRVDSAGWTAEMRIPLSQLRFTDRGAGAKWGINFGRDVARTDERSYWSPVTPASSRFVSAAGDLLGVSGLRPQRTLELRPYSVASVARAPGDAANPFYRRNAMSASVGTDLLYGVTPNFTLSATLNPDFGQVEADPSYVNLSAYEQFLPERRPFFVEDIDVFRFGLGAGDGDFGNESLFYTRRVGRNPQRGGINGQWVDAPDATTILGAAKLSGRTASGWEVGLLDAVTGEESARLVKGAGGPVERLTTEPLTNYAVARVRRNLADGQGAFGAIATATNRRLEEGSGMEFLPSSAYAGGVDGRLRFAKGSHELRSWLLGSRVEGDSAAMWRLQRSSRRYFQRPDADHVELNPRLDALDGWAGSVLVERIAGGRWNYAAIATARSPGFEVNDLGYQRQADMVMTGGFAQYYMSEPRGPFRNYRISSSASTGFDFGRERVHTEQNANGSFQLRNFWGAFGGISRSYAGLSTNALRGGPALVTPGSTNGWAGFFSDNRKPVTTESWIGLGREDGTDGSSMMLNSSIRWRPSSRAELSLNPGLRWQRDPAQWVESRSLDGSPHYAFAQLEQRTASLTARLAYTFSPNLSLQLYGQPFISAGEYSRFSVVDDPRAPTFEGRFQRFADRFSDLAPLGDGRRGAQVDQDPAHDLSLSDPDFNFKQFRSNLVLRWEYLPGSTLFVVWSQGREQHLRDGTFGLGRDVGRLFGMDDEFPVPSTNVLMVKFNYWLGG